MLLSKNIYSYIIFLLLAFFQIKPLSSIGKTNDTFRRFNNLMDKIDLNIRNGNLNEACKSSKFAAEQIELNLDALKKKQPNYSWYEIKNLLEIIPIQLCSE